MLLVATFAQPVTPQQGQWVKLSKLVKKARQLGCETFSRSVDVVLVKNWLKKISDILTDMELEYDLKLRVTIRLINKSATTWWEPLNFEQLHQLLGICSFESSTNSFILGSIGTKKTGILSVETVWQNSY